jgi:hypothetical protein
MPLRLSGLSRGRDMSLVIDGVDQDEIAFLKFLELAAAEEAASNEGKTEEEVKASNLVASAENTKAGYVQEKEDEAKVDQSKLYETRVLRKRKGMSASERAEEVYNKLSELGKLNHRLEVKSWTNDDVIGLEAGDVYRARFEAWNHGHGHDDAVRRGGKFNLATPFVHSSLPTGMAILEGNKIGYALYQGIVGRLGVMNKIDNKGRINTYKKRRHLQNKFSWLLRQAKTTGIEIDKGEWDKLGRPNGWFVWGCYMSASSYLHQYLEGLRRDALVQNKQEGELTSVKTGIDGVIGSVRRGGLYVGAGKLNSKGGVGGVDSFWKEGKNNSSY